MQDIEEIPYTEAKDYADKNQIKAINLIPQKLVEKEDHFLDRVRNAKVGPYKKLLMLYDLMDQLSAAMSPAMPCKKGCSSCCHYNVSVSEIEVAYIEQASKTKRAKRLAPAKEFHGTPCTFLKNGACSIYSARPFVCRRHNALTQNAYWCHPDRSDLSFPLIGFTNIDGAFDHIRKESGSVEPKDIRQYFY